MTALRWAIRLVVFVWWLPAILLALSCLAGLSVLVACYRVRLAWRRARS